MTLRATTPSDLLATIPHTLRFTPTDSLVLVSITTTGALGATLRVDLPSLSNSGAGEKFAAMMRQDPAADSVVVVFYDAAPQPVRWSERTEYLKLVDALDYVGLPVSDAWLVGETHFTNLLCDAGCCEPVPVESITDSAINAAMVYNSSAPAKQAGVVVPTPPTGEKLERMLALIKAVDLHPLNDDPMDFGQPAIASASVEWWCALDSEPDEETAAHLIAHIGRSTVRDRLVGDVIGAPMDDAGFRAALVGRSERINWDEAVKYQRLALHLLNHAPEGEPRAELLCLAAFIEWHKGRGSNTESLLVQARLTAPDHRLSLLLTQLIQTGILATVSTSDETSYKGD